MITRRRTLAAIAAAIAAPFVSREAAAATHPGPKPPPKPPRPPMTDYKITQREDMYVVVPLPNPDGTIPDPAAITGCKLSVFENGFGGTSFLADVTLGSGITVALGTDASGNLACLATCHWTPAQSIATRVLTQQLTCVGTLNVQAAGIITQPQDALRIIIYPATTVGV